ncbi:KilA-N domain-containing protein [Capnocytophaga sputigena]|uniref:KilA-N domain-containing protein n=1 Tax=Capnocytophaga sputigena TaxID=1019 RepID=UPI0028E99954|nr:KilA-N domain-containing protein [Capnocytophaga sputigena]
MTPTNNKLKVQDVEISLATIDNQDYISLTDMAKGKNDEARAADIIKNRSTLEFLGTWEMLYNPNFKVVEFDHFKKEAGLPTFTISVSNWVESTSEIY